MTYCLNPSCSSPENPDTAERCQTCGATLRLRDRYRVGRALGQGGFGATFLAQDMSLPGTPFCVIKQLRPASSSPHVLKMARDLFKREAKTLGKLGNHPQLPRLLDYFENNQEFYLVQEYVSGLTLQQEIKQGGPFTEAGVKQFLSEILPVLEYLHNQQVIHRDLKPGNLIRREQDKKLVLIDFGAVKDKVNPVRASASEQTALTAYAIGTPGYAPPEQMAMRPVYASDVYALGVTCIYLLTGKSPKDLDYDPATGEILWEDRVDVSEHFADVLHKMLEVSVKHRYQSAEEVLRALDMAPYLESLAQNMAIQTPGMVPPPPKPEKVTNARLKDDEMVSTPSARIAAAIRARKSRRRTDAETTTASHRRLPSHRRGSSQVGGAGQQRSSSSTNNSAPLTGNSGNSEGHTKFQTTGSSQSRIGTHLSEAKVTGAYAKGRRDFAYYDLSNLDLRKTNLAGANFNQAKLHKVNFQAAKLTQVDLGRANLVNSNLKNAKLGRAYLGHANLEGADLRGADLSYAHFSNANLRGANLCGADLTGARIDEGQIKMAKTNWATIYPNGKRGIW